MPIMFDVENEKQYRLPLTENQNETSRNYEIKILSIGFFTSPSQAVIWRDQWPQSVEPNDFDADWEN
jgi:ATP-binding protein involved in chromosome partitioning